MSNWKRFLLLGSILLLAVGLFTFSPQAPLAHASCSQGCPINSCPPTQKENSGTNNSSWVEVVQYSLNAFVEDYVGYSFTYWPLSIDGSFGPKTESAVVAWQKYASITVSGAVDAQTWQSLGLCPGSQASARNVYPNGKKTCPPTQVENGSGNSPVLVQAVQDMLNLLYQQHYISSSYPDSWSPYLASDGSFGPQTKAALYNFSGTTSVNATAWAKFGMCWT